MHALFALLEMLPCPLSLPPLIASALVTFSRKLLIPPVWSWYTAQFLVSCTHLWHPLVIDISLVSLIMMGKDLCHLSGGRSVNLEIMRVRIEVIFLPRSFKREKGLAGRHESISVLISLASTKESFSCSESLGSMKSHQPVIQRAHALLSQCHHWRAMCLQPASLMT